MTKVLRKSIFIEIEIDRMSNEFPSWKGSKEARLWWLGIAAIVGDGHWVILNREFAIVRRVQKGRWLYRINCQDDLSTTGETLVLGPLMGEASLENGLEALSHMGIEVVWEKIWPYPESKPARVTFFLVIKVVEGKV